MISILTPTKDREHLLPAIRACVESQTIQDIEWLVHDGSPSPSPFLSGLADERVRYIHDPQPMTIGAKRNALVKEAHGDILIHFDDDDHYAPHYIETMLTLMATSGADIVKLFGFHLFHRRTGMFAYWDLQNAFPLHHMLHPDADDFPLGPKSQTPNEEWGYGFSYVYRRKVWEAHPFPDTSDGEDQQFAVNAISQFKHAGMQDTGFVAVHVIHGSNTSYAYPQQLLPQAFGEAYFPGFTPEALMSQDAQMKEHAFPNLRETNYRLFDDDLENDAHVFFHATHADNFAAITQSGFKLPLPTRENPYPAVSFAKNSTWSLTWAMGKRNEQPGEWVMFAVRYDDLAGLDDQGIDVHDRKLKPQPTIIGYCRIPESYRHI